MTLAHSVQGSNSIEGYLATLDDVAAAVDDEPTLGASEETEQALHGYRDAMTYVLQVAQDPSATIDASLLKALHFMMLRHDLALRPGRWRAGFVGVHDERSGELVYHAPDAERVPALIEAMLDRPDRRRAAAAGARGDGPPEPRDDPSLPRRQRPHGALPADARARARADRHPGAVEHRGGAGTRRARLLRRPRRGRRRGAGDRSGAPGRGCASASPRTTARRRPTCVASARPSSCGSPAPTSSSSGRLRSGRPARCSMRAARAARAQPVLPRGRRERPPRSRSPS